MLTIGDETTYLVVAVTATVVSPLILAVITNSQHRRDRKEDWRRQDEVRDQAAKAAELLIISNNSTTNIANATNRKLDIIHTLVNSNMTAAMQAELDATVREVAMMKEVIALNIAAGRSPSSESEAAIKLTQGKINELKAALKDRLVATDKVNQREKSG